MAFYLKLKDGRHYTWNINNPLTNAESRFWADDIGMLRADGDELEFIINKIKKYSGLNMVPHCYHVCIWRDLYAQFIWDNILNK